MIYDDAIGLFKEVCDELKCLSFYWQETRNFIVGPYEIQFPLDAWGSNYVFFTASVGKYNHQQNNLTKEFLLEFLSPYKNCFRRDLGFLSMCYNSLYYLDFSYIDKKHRFDVDDNLRQLLIACRREKCTVGQILDYLQEHDDVPRWLIKAYQKEVAE